MANTKKTPWIPIILGVIAVVVVLGIALVGGVAYYISRNVHVRAQFVSTENAEAQFESARQRFVGQTPLIEMRKDGEPLIHRSAEDTHARPIAMIHAMVYSPDSRKLVNVNMPVWLLRMTPGKRFSFLNDDVDFDSGRIHLTFEDVERHGPGLILDQADRMGARILVWAE
jgi:hypothetical protein